MNTFSATAGFFLFFTLVSFCCTGAMFHEYRRTAFKRSSLLSALRGKEIEATTRMPVVWAYLITTILVTVLLGVYLWLVLSRIS
jgi:hypothetical protein